jgi:hypothetical protein
MNVMDDSKEELANAFAAIAETLAGMVKLRRFVSLNADAPIDSSAGLPAKVTAARDSDPENASSPIEVTLEGIETETTELFLNASSAIDMTPSGMSARPAQPELVVTIKSVTVNVPAPVVEPSVRQL